MNNFYPNYNERNVHILGEKEQKSEQQNINIIQLVRLQTHVPTPSSSNKY